MAIKWLVKRKNSNPVAGNLDVGELGYNTSAKKLFVGNGAEAPTGVSMDGHGHTVSQITDFPSSMPASDVYSWAKAATKPTYTKSEVGLGNVQNYGIATQAEAEAGTSNIKYMTPLRVKEAVMKFAGTGINNVVELFSGVINVPGSDSIATIPCSDDLRNYAFLVFLVSRTSNTSFPRALIWWQQNFNYEYKKNAGTISYGENGNLSYIYGFTISYSGYSELRVNYGFVAKIQQASPQFEFDDLDWGTYIHKIYGIRKGDA